MINNRCVFIGRLTKDVEVKEKDNNKYTNFQLAVDNGRDKTGNKKKPNYPYFTAFGKIAEHLGKYGKKGTMVAIESKLETGSYQEGGKTVYKNDFIVTAYPFLAGSGNQESQDNSQNQPPFPGLENQPPQQYYSEQPNYGNNQPGYYPNNDPSWPNNQPRNNGPHGY